MGKQEWLELFKQINGRPPSPVEFKQGLANGEFINDTVAEQTGEKEAHQTVPTQANPVEPPQVAQVVENGETHERPQETNTPVTPLATHPVHAQPSEQTLTQEQEGYQAQPTQVQLTPTTGFNQTEQVTANQANQANQVSQATPPQPTAQPEQTLEVEQTTPQAIKAKPATNKKKMITLILAAALALLAIFGITSYISNHSDFKVSAADSKTNIMEALEDHWTLNEDYFFSTYDPANGTNLIIVSYDAKNKDNIMLDESDELGIIYYTYADFVKAVGKDKVKSISEIKKELKKAAGSNDVTGMLIYASGEAYFLVNRGQSIYGTNLIEGTPELWFGLGNGLFDKYVAPTDQGFKDIEGKYYSFGLPHVIENGIVNNGTKLVTFDEYTRIVKRYQDKFGKDSLKLYTRDDIDEMIDYGNLVEEGKVFITAKYVLDEEPQFYFYHYDSDTIYYINTGFETDPEYIETLTPSSSSLDDDSFWDDDEDEDF